MMAERAAASRSSAAAVRLGGGPRAQGLAGLIDRMRLHRPRLGAKAGERGVGARRAGVSFGWERRPQSPDCAERIGWGRLRRSALVRGRVAPFRFGGERGDDRAALLKPGLPGREFAELARERFEVERPLAGDLVEFERALRPGGSRRRFPLPPAARPSPPSGRRERRDRRRRRRTRRIGAPRAPRAPISPPAAA